MAKTKNMDLTQGSVTKKLMIFALPIILTNLLQHAYTLADRIVVGNFAQNGKVALAAVGATSHPINLLLGLFTGIGVGVNVVCANLHGARDAKGLRKCMHTCLVLATIMGLAMAFVGFFLSEQILVLLGTPRDVLADATLYMQIYFLGVPASIMYNFGAAILRSHGDTRRPMTILGSTGIVNVLLNLVLVIGLGRGVDGVAIATITAQYLSAAWVLLCLFRDGGEYDLNVRELKLHKDHALRVIGVGSACGINTMLFNIANVILQSSINSFDDPAIIAGGTAATDLNQIQSLILSGFSMACVSFSGQCMGARKYKRIDQLYRSAVIWPGVVMIVFSLVCTFFPEPLLRMFNPDADVIAAGVVKLRIICWGVVGYVLADVGVGCMRGMKKSTMPTLLNVFGVCGTRLIWILIFFPMNRTPEFLYLCYPISWCCSSALQTVYFFHCRKQLQAMNSTPT